MEELIYDLENKRTEIYTDLEDTDWSEEYMQGYLDSWLNAFDLAIVMVKEHSNLI